MDHRHPVAVPGAENGKHLRSQRYLRQHHNNAPPGVQHPVYHGQDNAGLSGAGHAKQQCRACLPRIGKPGQDAHRVGLLPVKRERRAQSCVPQRRCLRVFRQHAAHLAPEQSLLHQRPQNRRGHAGVLSEGGCGDRFGRIQQDTQHRALGG